MSDALRLSLAAIDDGSEELLSPLCRAIVNGEHRERPRSRDDDRARLLAEIDAMRERIVKLEASAKRKPRKTSKSDLEMLAASIGKVLGEELKPLQEKIDKLEAQSLGVKWAGTWHDGMRCAEGELITDKGSLWICTAPSRDRPGDNASAFKLVVKNGHADNGARRHATTAIRQ